MYEYLLFTASLKLPSFEGVKTSSVDHESLVWSVEWGVYCIGS